MFSLSMGVNSLRGARTGKGSNCDDVGGLSGSFGLGGVNDSRRSGSIGSDGGRNDVLGFGSIG